MDVWSGLQLFCAAATVALNYSRCGADTLQLQSVRVLPLRHGSGDLEPPEKGKKKTCSTLIFQFRCPTPQSGMKQIVLNGLRNKQTIKNYKEPILFFLFFSKLNHITFYGCTSTTTTSTHSTFRGGGDMPKITQFHIITILVTKRVEAQDISSSMILLSLQSGIMSRFGSVHTAATGDVAQYFCGLLTKSPTRIHAPPTQILHSDARKTCF